MKKSFETFKDIGNYEISNLTKSVPDCFNGNVFVTKKRITIEDVEEPIEVIRSRIKKLWDEIDNHHNREPLREKAKKYGMEL